MVCVEMGSFIVVASIVVNASVIAFTVVGTDVLLIMVDGAVVSIVVAAGVNSVEVCDFVVGLTVVPIMVVDSAVVSFIMMVDGAVVSIVVASAVISIEVNDLAVSSIVVENMVVDSAVVSSWLMGVSRVVTEWAVGFMVVTGGCCVMVELLTVVVRVEISAYPKVVTIVFVSNVVGFAVGVSMIVDPVVVPIAAGMVDISVIPLVLATVGVIIALSFAVVVVSLDLDVDVVSVGASVVVDSMVINVVAALTEVRPEEVSVGVLVPFSIVAGKLEASVGAVIVVSLVLGRVVLLMVVHFVFVLEVVKAVVILMVYCVAASNVVVLLGYAVDWTLEPIVDAAVVV